MFPQENQVVNVRGSAYKIIKTIGEGGQGIVYEGSSQKGEKVVIQYKDSISNSEYEILQSLIKNPKPNIIGIKAVEREITGQTVIVMEFVNNEFYQYMIENPEFQTLSKDQRNQILYQMVEAVKELHDQGYFHRDFKPENFLVFNKEANGFIKTKLIDLGLCKQQQSQNMEHTRNVGTPFFEAPEIFNGSLIYDHHVDSWTLGCIWYELITGQTFFIGNDQNEVFQNIKNATQLQIDQKIESQQIFTQQEKLLLKSYQQNQIVQLNEKNKEKMLQYDQQQKALFAQFQNYLHLNDEIKLQVNKLKDSFDNLKNEFKTELEKLDSLKYESEEQLKQYIEDNQKISNLFTPKFEDKKIAAQNLLQQLFQSQEVKDEKQKLFNQFNTQCNQVKQTLKFKQFTFDNNFQVYEEIRKQPCQKELKQCLEYLQLCQKKQNENKQLFNDLTKNLEGKNSFSIQKNKIEQELQNLYNKSVKSINELHEFKDQFIIPYKQNFDQVENEDDQQFQKLAILKQIQVRVENLSIENLDLIQKTQNNYIDNQKFLNKIMQDLEEITNYQNDLQQMNLQEIQQFNLKIPNIINSWFVQMLLITIIVSYKKQNLIQRKLLKAAENGNQEQLQQLLNEQNKMKDQMLKCQSYLDSKQFNELNIEELIENQRSIKQSFEKDQNEIKDNNRVKLKGVVKNQEVIKDCVEMTQFGEFTNISCSIRLQQQIKF